MSADPEKAMEVVDDNDHESLDEDDEAATDGDKMEVLFSQSPICEHPFITGMMALGMVGKLTMA